MPHDIENSYDKGLPGKLSEMSEAERAFMRAGAKGLSSTDASRLAEGMEIDQTSAWNAWEMGAKEYENGNGESLELLIDATDYLDRTGESVPLTDSVEDTDIDNVKENDIIKENIPYMKSRPTYTDGQVEAVWESWKSADGKVYDPSGQGIIWDKTKPRKGQWDMGHIPDQKYAEIHAKYVRGKITKEAFLAWYRNPANYLPELPKTNRSHKYE